MKHTKIFLTVLVMVFINLTEFAFAKEGAGKVSFAVENDVIFEKDRDYTNGLFLSWTPKDSRFNFTLAQKIYTPSKHDDVIYPNDHPYAGYAYFQTTYKKLLSENFRANSGITLAQLGPKAKAEQVQNGFHRKIDAEEFEGWHYQIPNRRGYLVNIGLDYLIPLASVDTNFIDIQTIASVNGTSGNVENSALGSLGINLGYNVDKYSDKIDPDGSFRLYIFGRGGFKMVNKDYILEGNNGRVINGQTWNIEIEKQVYSINYGVVLGWKNADVKIYSEQKTKHYLTQQQTYQISGLMLSWKY